jgi:hypothetical protein
LAIWLILLLTSGLPFLIISRINEASAKICSNEGMSNETIPSCGSQDKSSTFMSYPSIPGTDDNTKEINDGGEDVLSADSTSKHSHHDSNSGDPEKNTPFKLPFP